MWIAQETSVPLRKLFLLLKMSFPSIPLLAVKHYPLPMPGCPDRLSHPFSGRSNSQYHVMLSITIDEKHLEDRNLCPPRALGLTWQDTEHRPRRVLNQGRKRHERQTLQPPPPPWELPAFPGSN